MNEPRQLRCAHCRTPIERTGNDFFPFCSHRCQMVDLGKWLGESYRLAAPVTERNIDELQQELSRAARGDDES